MTSIYLVSGKHLDGATRVSLIQCYKLGIQTKDIIKKTAVSEESVRCLVDKFKASPSVCVPTYSKSTGRPTNIDETSLGVLKRCRDVPPTLTILRKVSSIFVGLPVLLA